MAMGNSQHLEQRKTILIDRDFQLSFIGRLGGFLLFYLLLFLIIAIVAPVVFTFLGDPPEWALMETAFRVEVLMLAEDVLDQVTLRGSRPNGALCVGCSVRKRERAASSSR